MDGMNQLMGYIILERLTRLTEGSNVLEARQGGYREGRGGDLNMHKIDYLAHQAREQHRVLLRTDIDFANAFNNVSHGALWVVLEGFRVPDVDWLKQLYAKLTVRLKGETDVGSIMVLNTGVDQGHVLSPFQFKRAKSIRANFVRSVNLENLLLTFLEHYAMFPVEFLVKQDHQQ